MSHPVGYWHWLDDGRMQCELCPRDCRLHDGQRGACFVRKRQGEQMLLTTYGRSSGFCIDPIEKKPLYHYYPGSKVLSFGTAGCNLACKFCQNWDISKSRDMDRLMDCATPDELAMTAAQHACKSIAFTYNDPVIFAEYAIDCAQQAQAQGIRTVAVTAAYISPAARRDFFQVMDAANVDLKAFNDDFYVKLCGGRLAPVLDNLIWMRHDTAVWIELTTLLIPGKNDSDTEVRALGQWVCRELGSEVPLHLTAFHPDFKLTSIPATPASSLRRAREIALDAGLQHVYVGNVHDSEADTTYCPNCAHAVIVRDWYKILHYELDACGCCSKCGTALPGHFEPFTGAFGPKRVPISIQHKPQR